MKKNYLAKGTFILLVSIPFLSFSQSMLADKIVGTVADKIVLKSEVEGQYYQYVASGDTVPDMRCLILNQMMTQKLLFNQAQRDSIEITDEEVEDKLDRNIRYFSSQMGSKEALENYYKKSILEIKEEFREDIRSNILSERMQGKITKDIKITPAEVKEFFKSIPEDSLPFLNAEAEIGQIVIYPKVSSEMKELTKEKINQIRKDIVDGGQDFATKAIAYSEDPGSANKGGELGFQSRGELVPEFEAVAFKLKEGEISKVIETKFGFHIIQMIERRGEKVNVRHIVVRPKTTSFDLQQPKKILDSVRNLIITKSLTFNDAVGKFSEDEDTKHNGGMLVNPQTGSTYFEISQLDRSLYFVIDTMKTGDLSVPAVFQTKEGQQAYRLVWLKTETQPHKANLKDDYNRIQSVALSKKEKDAMEKWMKEKIAKTYIMIDKEFHDCEAMKLWIKNSSTINNKND